MQINSVTTSQVLPLARTATSVNSGNAASTTGDQAVLNTSANKFASYVQQASSMPEVRSEVVDAYKARIASGRYPAQDVIAGLTRLMGGGIVSAAESGASFPDTQD